MIVKCEKGRGFSFLGLSETGESHLKNKMQNQDCIGFSNLRDSLVIALSDGLGSCRHSDIGAKKVVLICETIQAEIENEQTAFDAQVIARRILSLWNAAFSKETSKEYSATMKAVFIKGKDIITFSVGDVCLALLSGDKVIEGFEVESDFVNSTDCLSFNMDVAHLNPATYHIEQDRLLLFVCTDGVSSGILPNKTKEFMIRIDEMAFANKLDDNLRDFITELSKYNSDDKTIGVLQYENAKS